MNNLHRFAVLAAIVISSVTTACAQSWPDDSEGVGDDPSFGSGGSFRPYAFSPSYGTGGVDPASGIAGGNQTLLTIGDPNVGGLSYARKFVDPKGHYDNFSGGIEVREGSDGRPSFVVVTALGVPYQFVVDGNSYKPLFGTGAELTKSGSTWRMVGRHGTAYEFDESLGSRAPLFAPDGRLTRVSYPNGVDLDLYYLERTLCRFRRTIDGSETCISEVTKHRLTSVESSLGYQIAYEYQATLAQDDIDDDSHTRIVNVRAINNRYDVCPRSGGACTGLSKSYPVVGFAESATGQGVVVTNAEGEVATYEYDSNDRLESIDYGDTAQADAVYTYRNDRVSNATIAGSQWKYRYFDNNGTRQTVTTDPAQKEWITETDLSTTQLIESTNPAGERTKYRYYDAGTSFGLLEKVVSPIGATTRYTYDDRGNLTETKQTPAGGGAAISVEASYPAACSSTTRKSCNKPRTTTDELGRVTTYTYDEAHGGVASVTYAAASGQAAQTQGVTYVSRTARYYAEGGVRQSRRPVWLPHTQVSGELTSTFQYESGGNRNLLPTTVHVVANDGSVNQTTAMSHDHVGNITTVDGPLAGDVDETRMRYDLMRRPTISIALDPDGTGSASRQAAYRYYDEAGRLERVDVGAASSLSATALSRVLEQRFSEYDSYGRLRQQRFVAGGSVRSATDYVYDATGRLSCVIQPMKMPANQPKNSCSAGPISLPYGQHRISRRYYDNVGRVSIVENGYGTDVVSKERVGYYPNGQVAWVIDGENNRTDYAIDGFGRVERTDYPGAVGYEQTYYVPGTNLVDKVRRKDGSIVDYGYDGIGRLTSMDYPGGADDLSISYDARHRRQTMSSNRGALSYTYDDAGRLLSETSSRGTVGYGYDALGRRDRLDYPGTDGFHVTYEYEGAGPLKRIREGGSNDVLATFKHDQLGRRTRLDRGNGTWTGYGFDNASDFASMAFGLPNDNSYNLNRSFERNPAGQIVEAFDSKGSYHPIVSIEDIQATFDAGNRLDTFADASATHDARGNLTSDGALSLTYSTLNQLASVNGDEIKMYYDPAGRMREEIVDGTRTLLAYDGASLIAEYDSGGNLQRRYVHGPSSDEPIVWYEGSNMQDRRYLTADERGSIMLVTNDAGRVVRRNYYDENGTPSSNNLGRFGFTGQTRIGGASKWQLALWHYKARAYASRQGRFMQSDPIGYGDGMNMYGYVKSDPINSVDPSGTETWDCSTGTEFITCGRPDAVIPCGIGTFCYGNLGGNGPENGPGNTPGGGDGSGGSNGNDDECSDRDRKNLKDYADPSDVVRVLLRVYNQSTKLQFFSGNSGLGIGSVPGGRYLYTERSGWLDLQHTASAMDNVAAPFFASKLVGYGVEIKQWVQGEDSAFQSEDILGNKIGADAYGAIAMGATVEQGVNSALEGYGPMSRGAAAEALGCN